MFSCRELIKSYTYDVSSVRPRWRQSNDASYVFYVTYYKYCDEIMRDESRRKIITNFLYTYVCSKMKSVKFVLYLLGVF